MALTVLDPKIIHKGPWLLDESVLKSLDKLVSSIEELLDKEFEKNITEDIEDKDSLKSYYSKYNKSEVTLIDKKAHRLS